MREKVISVKEKFVQLGHLGIRISIGAITNVHKLATALLEKPHQEIKQKVLKEANVNVDESSWYLRSKRCWVWVGATFKAIFFQINAGRSRAAFEEIFADFKNTLTSDRYSAYNKYEGSKQSCLSHILRDLTKMSEREGVDGVFGRILEDQMKELFGCWSRAKTLNVSRSKLREWCLPYVENIKTALVTIVSINRALSKLM